MSAQRYHWLTRVRPAFLGSFLKRVLRVQRRGVSTAAGEFFIDPASNFGDSLLRDGEYEPQMAETVTSLLSEGDTFVDLGANEGYFTIIAAKRVGPSGEVVCIEPQTRLQGVLHRNITSNGLRNVLVVQRAISDSDGLATLALSPDVNTGSSGLLRATRYSGEEQVVLQSTLKNLFGALRINKVRLIKIDVEGFEYEAILGSKDVFISGVVEHIALELHDDMLERRGRSSADIVQFLETCGYRMNSQCPTMVFSRV
ncbi:FkbM family methyltransferase [Caulifigura coniformis]|nr:FkbM family methyltransferase [Caulifigura coniformis]